MKFYTSVTVSPPPNWSVPSLTRNNQTPAPIAGAFTFAPLDEVSLSWLLNSGFLITALTP